MLDAPDELQPTAVQEKEPEEIRADMEETRASLTEKLNTLEHTVKDTVQTVKDNVDPRHHMRVHPWATVGGAVFAGFLLGKLAPSSRNKTAWPPGRAYPAGPTTNGTSASAAAGISNGPLAPEESKPGLIRRLASQFGEEIEVLEGAAIAAGIGLLRDWAKESLPKFAPDIDKAMNRIITKVSDQSSSI